MSKDEAVKSFWTNLITSILFIGFGIYLLFKPDSAIKIIANLIALITTSIGIFGLFRYFTRDAKEKKINVNLLYSIVSFVVAIIMLLKPEIIAKILPIVMGIYMIINTLCNFGYLKHLKKNNSKDFGICIFMFIIMLVLGVIIIFNPLESVLRGHQALGMLLTTYSILNIINSYLYKNNVE